MFWSISPEGRIHHLPSEEFARNWAKTYADDNVFMADLTPLQEASTQPDDTYSEEVKRRLAGTNPFNQERHP